LDFALHTLATFYYTAAHLFIPTTLNPEPSPSRSFGSQTSIVDFLPQLTKVENTNGFFLLFFSSSFFRKQKKKKSLLTLFPLLLSNPASSTTFSAQLWRCPAKLDSTTTPRFFLRSSRRQPLQLNHGIDRRQAQ
jgi:hypothetical protein